MKRTFFKSKTETASSVKTFNTWFDTDNTNSNYNGSYGHAMDNVDTQGLQLDNSEQPKSFKKLTDDDNNQKKMIKNMAKGNILISDKNEDTHVFQLEEETA